jgi:[citrate (pro-3S)-lyase] ligase
MQEILIPRGIDLIVVPRKEINGEPISASKVRELLEEEKFKEIVNLVPPTTYNFLISKEAKPIIDKAKKNHSRH